MSFSFQRRAPLQLSLGLLIFFLGGSVSPTYSQEAPDPQPVISLHGTVFADDTGDPLQGATVVLRRVSDSTLVTGSVTNAEGRFAVRSVPEGRYHVRISYVGFAAMDRPNLELSSREPTINLGIVRLAPVTTSADGVEITGERELMEVQIDRTVFNVKDQITAIGGSASDVLQDLPSIEVDLDGNVSYRGNENVAIHLNGRPSSLTGAALASFLKSLSSASVERVEVLPNPSARYEPDGMAGIINIVLVENRSAGWSGGLTGGVGTNQAYNGSANVGYQHGSWQLFSTYGYRYDTRDVSGVRLRENLLQSPSVLLNQTTADEQARQSHAWTTQAEYQMGGGSVLSLQTVLSSRERSEEGRTTYVEEVEETIDNQFARLLDGTRSDLGVDTRLTFDHEFGHEDHQLTAEVRFERDWEDEEGVYAEHSLFDESTIGDPFRREDEHVSEDEQEGTVRVDYTRPLGRMTWETGYQGSLRRQDTRQEYESILLADNDVSTSLNAFGFEEQIHAGFGILSAEVG